MKLLIIAHNQERSPMPVMPIGAAQVAGTVRQHGHDVQLLDLFWNEDPVQAAAQAVKDYQPDLVGLSLRNVDNTDMYFNACYLDYTKRVVDAVKSASEAPIAVGGCGFSLFPEELMAYLDVPYGIAGEAELAFPALLDCISAGRSPDGLAGACYRRGQEVVVNPPQYIPNIDKLPMPALDLLNPKPYLEKGGQQAIEGRRGCNLNCSYCWEKGPAGFRLRQPKDVVDQMEAVIDQFGLRSFTFTDGVLNWPPEHGMGICQEIIDRKLQLNWGAMINPLGVNKEMVQLMKQSGCSFMSVGLDAASDKMLRSYHKGFSKEDIANAARLLKDHGIFSVTTLLFGGPGETMDTVQESLDLLSTIPVAVVYLSLGVRIYANTELADAAIRDGFWDGTESLMQPKFYLSKALPENIVDRLDEYAGARPMWATSSLAAKRAAVTLSSNPA